VGPDGDSAGHPERAQVVGESLSVTLVVLEGSVLSTDRKKKEEEEEEVEDLT
jgi:hypothetical protein